MSELAKLLKSPDYSSFKDWEPENDAGDPIENRKSYADYVRGEYLKAGSYNSVIENDIRTATRDGAASAGLIDPTKKEDIESLFVAKEPAIETKFEAIRTTLDSEDPAWKAVNRYLTFKSIHPDIDSLAPDLVGFHDQYKQEAEQAVEKGFDTAKRIKVRNGEMPLAKVMDDDGKQEIIAGSMMDSMSLPEAIRSSKSGGINFSDSLNVQSLVSTPVGYKTPLYKAARYNEAAGMISELAKNDEKTSKIIDDFGTSLSMADSDNREVFEGQKPDVASVRRALNENLTAGHTFTDDEVDKAITQLAYHSASDQNKFKFYDDPKEIGRNIRNVGYATPIVHPALMANKPLFEQALAAHPEMSDDQRTALTAQREISVANSFEGYNKTLTDSTVSGEWLNALQRGRASGQKDTDTLEQFVANPDNFNELSSRVGGIKESILDGFGELVAAVPAMMGADWARDYMVSNIKEKQNRRETARLFGKEYGMGQDLGETIAPMLIDMAATTLLTIGSAPVGGAAGVAYATAKSGARLTAKGLVKGLTSGAFRQLPTETLEDAAQRLVVTGLVKDSVGSAGKNGAMAVIEGYSGQLAKTIGTGSAMAIPAFNRSGGATYANVYSQLESNKDITPEERHDRALGAGLAAGAITAALTAGFSAFGRGGLEDALLSGATRKELKSVMARIANVDDISDDVFNKVVAKEVSGILKNYGTTLAKDAGKGFVDEGAEEGIDEFINGFITDAATDQDTPFLQRLEQAGRAAILGGVIGAGIPAIRAAAAPAFQQSTRERQVAIEIDFAKKVSSSLEASGSPLTAETVYGILSAPRRTRAKAAEAVLRGSRAAQPAPAAEVTPVAATVKGAPTEVAPTEVAPTEVAPTEVAPTEAAPTEAAPTETEPKYKAPDDFDVIHELLKKDIASAGELTDKFGDKLKVTAYDPENRTISYVDEEGIEYDTAIEQLDLTNNQEAIAKQKPKMPQTISEVAKISAALHANTSQESVAATIATDPNKAPEVGMDIDSIPNDVAKKKRKTAVKKGASPVAQQIEAKNAALKEANEAPTGQLELQLSVGGAPKVKVPRVERSIKQQTKTSLAEQLDLFPAEADSEEQSNHTGSSGEVEDVVEAVVEAAATSIPIPVAAAAQAIVVGKKPKEVLAKKPIKAKKPAAPVAVEAPLTFDEETFVDDEFTGQEISTLQRLIGYGFPVRLQAKELHGYPKRASYDKGYLSGKSDLINKKIAEIYKQIELGVQKNWSSVSGSKTTVFDPKSNKVVRVKTKGYINENGVGVFDNNPLAMMPLLENNHPVIIPEGFDINNINPAFRYSKLGNEYILTDIVKVNPATGSGFVSALTRQDTVASEEPNYDFIQKVSDFENLFDNRIAGGQEIADPANPNVKVELSILLNRVTDIRNKANGIGSAEGLSQPAAKAIIDNAIKPKVGNLTEDFSETASIAFDLAYRRSLRLHAMRLSFDKFSERKSGEAFPSLKADKMNSAVEQFVGLTRASGDNQKVTVAKRLQKTYGSDVNPETNPDLVIANFIEDHILTAPEVAPTFRSVGQKVGNMYAEQQRSRNIFARKALFQTTSPEDVAKLQADEAYDPMSEVSDYHIAPDKDLLSPTAQLTKGLMERTAMDAVDSIDADPELRTALNKLLRSTLYKGNSAFDVSGMTAQDAFSQLAQWMASGNYATNPEAVGFQRGLESGDYENGTALRDALKLMHIASRSVTGSIDQDPDYISELARNLSSANGTPVTERQAREFAKSIGQVATRLWSRSYVRGEQIQFARNLNEADVARLGLKNGDPQSVIDALKIIASTEADPNKKLLAKLLLENQSFIRQVTFSIDEVSLPYAGQYTLMADGTSAVSLNLDGYNGRGLSDALLHEYLHAFVNKVVSAPVELQTEDQRAAIQRLNGILNLVRDSAAANGIDSPMLTDGLVDLNEFVTHFFTSTDFQNLVKTLSPPVKQRGFFARIVDAILDVFGMGKSTQSAYQQAFMDVVDLTRSAIHSAPNTSNSLINKLAVKSSELLDNAKRVGSSFGSVTGDGTVSVEEEYAAAEAEEAAAKAADEVEVSDLMDQAAPETLPFDPTTDTNKSMIESMKRSMLLIRKLVPKEIKLQWDSNVSMAEVDLQTGEMFVNPQSIASLISGKTPAQARLAIKTMIDEEMRHVASFNSLTESEVATIADAKTDSDFEDIAEAYYGNEVNRAAALERLRSEDPAVSGAEKIRLVEERLRMLSQKVARGTTTEEDYAFWRTNPTTLSILGRYFKNMINSMFGGTTNINMDNNTASFVRGKTFLAMSADERVAVARIVTEMRALQAGYRLAPNSMRFNPENPSDVVGMFEAQLGTSFGDVSEELSRSSFPMSALELLHGAAVAASKSPNKDVANQLAYKAMGHWGKLLTSKDMEKAGTEWEIAITKNALQEVIAALNASGKNAADWYSTAIEVAMGVASIIHPELSDVNAARAIPAFAAAEDPVQAANFAMRMALAITSQNLNVEQNAKYANEQFELLKKNGKFDSSKVYGAKGEAIQSNLQLANILVAKKGYIAAEEFVRQKFTVKDLEEAASKIRNKKVSISGGKKDIVNGAAIFGPKIGQGFLQNLMSNFDPVTIDLWMRRTWGRWTGDVVGDGVTEDRLTKLITTARKVGMKLPSDLESIELVPAFTKAGKPAFVKGEPKFTIPQSVVAKLKTSATFRERMNNLAIQMDKQWQQIYKALGVPMNEATSDALLSGKITLFDFKKAFDKNQSKLAAEFKKRKAAGSLPSVAREVWKAAKIKDINKKAKKENLSDAARKTLLNELDDKFDKLAADSKLPTIAIADWRMQKYADEGADVFLNKEQIKSVKPDWANAASAIKAKLNPTDIPSALDRKVISRIVNNVRDQLQALGYTTTNADIQAILWYPEKDLWAKLRGEEESNLKSSYDDEFINIARQLGRGDEAIAKAESIRADRATRSGGRNDRRANGPVSGRANEAGKVQVGTSFGDVSRHSELEAKNKAGTITRSEMIEARELVQKAAKAAGFTIRAYHGSAAAGEPFTSFDPNKIDLRRGEYGFWFTSSKNLAREAYASRGEGNLYGVFLRPSGRGFMDFTSDIDGSLSEWATNAARLARAKAEKEIIEPLKGTGVVEYTKNGLYGLVGEEGAKVAVKLREKKFEYLKKIHSKAGYTGQIFPEEHGEAGITTYIATNPEDIKSSDPFTGVPLNRRFNPESNSILQTSFGDVSQLPARFDADKMDFSNFLQALEMPMIEVGTYRSPKNMLDRLFKGELDPRINTLKQHRDFFKSASMTLVQNYKSKLDGIIKKDFGSLENAPLDDIAAAIGSTHGTVLNQDVIDQIEDTYQASLQSISIDAALNAKQKTAARKIALDDKMKSVDAERTAQADAIRSARNAALESLANQSPDLARHIVQLRTLTDEVSKRVTSLYGFKPELQATFDSQLGIYLTRSYKMFHEVGFADIVRSDPAYAAQRQAAMDFFGNQFVEHETARRVAAGESQSDAENNARNDLANKASNGRSVAENALEEFIAHYEKKGISAPAGATMSESFRILQKNIKQKKDIPVELRNILGEYGPESGTDSLLRSFVTVSSMAANQSFLQHVKTIGVAGGWLMTKAELDAKLVTDYDAYKNYGVIRSVKEASAYDPLGDLFGPPELIEGLNKVFSSEARAQNMDAAQDLVAKTTNVFAKLTGGAMAAKTLGSVGFYIRNIVSNVLFFGPSQGYFSIGEMAESARKEIWSTLSDPNQIDTYRTELISLGVIGNEIKSTVMADLLRGTTTIQSVEGQLDKLIKIGHAGTKPLTWITEKAQQLASAADAFYKIAYYENELKVLKSARDSGGGKFATMSDYELNREAARKILMTAQSASQAPPIIKEATKSGIGLLFSPFLRFKAEVPRIVLNTYKLSFEEMKSDNSVIAARGQKRFAGMTFMLSGVSMIVPATIRALMGIGEDEDEALRASLPSYLRNHTFFYRRDDNGKLQSWDFTFLNPFSLLADPTMRSMELLLRGEPAKAAGKFVETAIFDQYLDDQIFSSAVQSLRDNRDPSTDKPIYEPKIDSTGAVVFKSMSHVFRQAYMPSSVNRIIKAYQAVGADYTEFDNSPAGILMQEFYPVKRHDIELDKQLRRYLSETRDVYNRINERKNVLFSKKPIDEDSIRDVIKSEVEDKVAMNEDIYRKIRGYEGLGMKPEDIYSVMTGKSMGYGKDRSRLLFNKMMDRPVLTPDFQDRLKNPENEQGIDRLLIANDELKKYTRYILIEP